MVLKGTDIIYFIGLTDTVINDDVYFIHEKL